MSLFLNVCVYSVPLSWIDIRIQLSHDLSFSFDSSVQKKNLQKTEKWHKNELFIVG